MEIVLNLINSENNSSLFSVSSLSNSDKNIIKFIILPYFFKAQPPINKSLKLIQKIGILNLLFLENLSGYYKMPLIIPIPKLLLS